MQSKTKVALSPRDIQRAATCAFGHVDLSSMRELADGYFNTAYHIELDDGRQTVLKVGPPKGADILTYERNILRAEADAMRLVTTDPAIPLPAVLFVDFSRTILPYEFYFMDFVEGTTWDKICDRLSDAQNSDIEQQLGQITARINAFEHPSFGYFAYGPDFDNWPDAFRWMCCSLFADARRYGISLELAEVDFLTQLDRYHVVLAEVIEPKLVHWDLWAGNIFVAVEGEDARITGLIDFERVLWGDPLMEVHLGRLRGIEPYMAGYGEDLLATQTQRMRRIFYNIYLHLVMIVEDGPRQYEDKGTVIWAKQRLREDIAMLQYGDIPE